MFLRFLMSFDARRHLFQSGFASAGKDFQCPEADISLKSISPCYSQSPLLSRFLFFQTHTTSNVFLQTHATYYVFLQFSYCTQ
jgi:hypothetical protein